MTWGHGDAGRGVAKWRVARSVDVVLCMPSAPEMRAHRSTQESALVTLAFAILSLVAGSQPVMAAAPPPPLYAADDAYVMEQDTSLVVTQTYPTYLAIGNSLTHNSPGSWNNNTPPGWGMNASAEDKDFVALITSFLRGRNSQSAAQVYDNGTARQPFGSVAAALSIIATYKAYHADVITVQLGENDRYMPLDEFRDKYADLLDALLDNTPRPKILCFGIWNSSSLYRPCLPGVPLTQCDHETELDAIISSLCAERKLIFRSVKYVAMDPANHNPGGGAYNWHPNDSGMEAYAALFATAYESLSPPLLMANDTFPAGAVVHAEMVTEPAHGTLSLGADGSFVYTPDEHFAGVDSFMYLVVGKTEASPAATVTIEVRQRNHSPEGVADVYLAEDDGSLSVPAPGVLTNDTDYDNDPLTAQIWVQPKYGQVTLNPDGSFTYTPGPSFKGSDEFAYRPYDGLRKGAVTAVSIGTRALGEPEAICRDSDTIVLKWRKPADPAFQAVSIQRAEGNGLFVQVGRTSAEEFVDSGLTEDRVYHYCLTVESPHPVRQTLLTAQTFRKIPDKRRGAIGPDGGTIWCAGASDSNILYHSDDAGETFTAVKDFGALAGGPVTAIFVDPFGSVYVSASDAAAMGDGKVYRSTDNGATWETCKTPTGDDLVLMDGLRAPASASTWFHSNGFDCGLDMLGQPMWMLGVFKHDNGPNNAYLYRSSDGITFEEDSQLADTYPLLRHIHSVAYDPYSERWYVAYGDSPRQFSVSEDGMSFTPLPPEARGASSVAAFTPEAILMSGEAYFNNGVWRSTDGGLTAVKTPMPAHSDLLCYGLKSFPDGEVWLASFRDTFPQPDEASCMWVSSDHGATWRRIAQESTDTANLSDPDFYTIASTASSALAGDYVFVDCWQSRYIARFRRLSGIGAASPPSITSIDASGSFVTVPHTLQATWMAEQGTAPIAEFEYAVGMQPEDPSTNYVVGWTSTGTTAGAIVPGLSLEAGRQYYFYVRARDSRGLTCLPVASAAVDVPADVERIGELWDLANGVLIRLRDKVVTCTVPGGFWVEEDDRAAALRVISPVEAAPGDRVTFTGALEASQDSRQFATSGAVVTCSGAPIPAPLSTPGAALLFQPANSLTPGVKDGGSTYGVGLLVRCWGFVRSSGLSDSVGPYFHLDDGSGLDEGSGIAGVRVRIAGEWPAVGTMVSATGVAAMESVAGCLVPVLITRSAEDVRLLIE